VVKVDEVMGCRRGRLLSGTRLIAPPGSVVQTSPLEKLSIVPEPSAPTNRPSLS
jgi:hypothetical protein